MSELNARERKPNEFKSRADCRPGALPERKRAPRAVRKLIGLQRRRTCEFDFVARRGGRMISGIEREDEGSRARARALLVFHAAFALVSLIFPANGARRDVALNPNKSNLTVATNQQLTRQPNRAEEREREGEI